MSNKQLYQLKRQTAKCISKAAKRYRKYLFYKQHSFMRFINPFGYDWAMSIWKDEPKTIETYLKILNLKETAK